MSGTLYVVGTPIGNLSDWSPRAVDTLGTVDFIAAEDTRVTLKLLNHFGIKKEMVSYYEHNRLVHRLSHYRAVPGSLRLLYTYRPALASGQKKTRPKPKLSACSFLFVQKQKKLQNPLMPGQAHPRGRLPRTHRTQCKRQRQLQICRHPRRWRKPDTLLRKHRRKYNHQKSDMP